MDVNNQLPERRAHGPTLDVIAVWETIQGEGPFAGRPAIFVRLAGCNLQCPMCDTDYTTTRASYSPIALFDKIKSIRESGLIVFTGGEPFRQDGLASLAQTLSLDGYLVQIETNGTMTPGPDWYMRTDSDANHLLDEVHIVCSPKTAVIQSAFVHRAVFKYVLDADAVDETDGLPLSALGMKGKPFRPPIRNRDEAAMIYVQPLDEKSESRNKLHVKAAIASCLKYGYSYSHQLHKLLGLD